MQSQDLSLARAKSQVVGNISLKEAEERLENLRRRLTDRLSRTKRIRFELRSSHYAHTLVCSDLDMCMESAPDYRV